jgi:hypothetical protein
VAVTVPEREASAAVPHLSRDAIKRQLQESGWGERIALGIRVGSSDCGLAKARGSEPRGCARCCGEVPVIVIVAVAVAVAVIEPRTALRANLGIRLGNDNDNGNDNGNDKR